MALRRMAIFDMGHDPFDFLVVIFIFKCSCRRVMMMIAGAVVVTTTSAIIALISSHLMIVKGGPSNRPIFPTAAVLMIVGKAGSRRGVVNVVAVLVIW